MDPIFPEALKSLQDADPEVYQLVKDEEVRRPHLQDLSLVQPALLDRSDSNQLSLS